MVTRRKCEVLVRRRELPISLALIEKKRRSCGNRHAGCKRVYLNPSVIVFTEIFMICCWECLLSKPLKFKIKKNRKWVYNGLRVTAIYKEIRWRNMSPNRRTLKTRNLRVAFAIHLCANKTYIQNERTAEILILYSSSREFQIINRRYQTQRQSSV